MIRYAYVYQNSVAELFYIDGDINTQRHPDFVAQCYDVDAYPDIQIGWVYDGVTFSPYVEPQPNAEELARAARAQRESLLRSIYDPGIMMALRALRMAITPEDTSYAEGKVSELDAYAEALLVIPDQPGFPQTITWPTAPTK